MAVSESPLPVLHPVPGVRIGVVEAAVRKAGSNDLVVMALDEGSQVAGVFTRNLFRAAPVRFAESHLRDDDPRYLLINTGNANAGTGQAGDRAVQQNCAALADQTGCRSTQVIPYSTGVIGEPLPADRIDAALPAAIDGLQADHWAEAADAIRTTDTRPKGRSLRLELSGGTITLTGIAKGSGMIRPDMATMLAYIATDAVIDAASLRRMLRDAVAVSFNRITVDGDTSTNDACTLIATSASGVTLADASDRERFLDALTTMCTALAREIVADGEGATRDLAIRVTGARTTAEAEQVAFTVAESPLVKTALFAADPNWGRILAAVGRAGIRDLDVDRVRIGIGDCRIVEGGGLSPHYDESAAAACMAADHVSMTIDLDRGGETATVWTCDFSYDYVRINAEYRS
ncbi:bifunctional glutamate N-acetyltransferase/amino-acid acetyltransferase ArgJ [Spiribacter vilamensis]|uniref:Arginine biosynthesis bifunctional protein ArgJ n=1 Tax=Spiribacter vilamensis TaxID=531306 RepID=A0A4Q8CY77_9GAMM|nr:bifunctional glutamate N-acetyltransferase/amino-acid acetyltransferase ArgJ [Spiribacter vilamensis]RZU97923.1 glutamate N-acetyltransferase [Spiribacter vilamensis]TVO61164.1 bifunctional glutamate N-acetyltransferase/amino-acid acetyltransferase ArgJ [Spiribacter vilamensis]